jgi:hypothetical protein
VTEDDWFSLGLFDDVHTIGPGETLTFGRQADLVVDTNRFMHRIVGRIVHRQGLWWIQNHCATIRLLVGNEDSTSAMVIAAGDQSPVLPTKFTIGFAAGTSSYELEAQRGGPELDLDEIERMMGTSTEDFGEIVLSAEQHLLLVALYDSSLRTGGSIEGSGVMARRLGWSAKKFHRKVDSVCSKLSDCGFAGLKGGQGDLADSRRVLLVQYALDLGLVSRGDLGLVRDDRSSG